MDQQRLSTRRHLTKQEDRLGSSHNGQGQRHGQRLWRPGEECDSVGGQGTPGEAQLRLTTHCQEHTGSQRAGCTLALLLTHWAWAARPTLNSAPTTT